MKTPRQILFERDASAGQKLDAIREEVVARECHGEELYPTGKITGINHLTLAVRDLNRSIAFYAGLLGCTARMQRPSSAYLESGTLWLALVVDSAVRTGPLPEYTHVAFSIPLLTCRL